MPGVLRSNIYGLLWAIFILILCGIPGQDIPHISFLELLSFDKFVHAAIFFVLVMLLYRGFRKSPNIRVVQTHPLLIALLFSIPYGGLLEIMQGMFFDNRSADLYDFIANSFGAICAALVIWRNNKALRRY
jgi:VanZ family protein